MFAVIRHYTASPKLADELATRRKDVESLIQAVPGFAAYYMLKTADGACSITVCESRDGCTESSKRAAEYLKSNIPNLTVNPPQIIEGDVAIAFSQVKPAVV